MAWRKKKKETERPHKLFPIQNYIALPPYTIMQRVHYRHLPSSQDATQIKVVLCHCERTYIFIFDQYQKETLFIRHLKADKRKWYQEGESDPSDIILSNV